MDRKSEMSATIQASATEDIGSDEVQISRESVPVIDLPHRWDEEGRLVKETIPAKCHVCDWSGDPRSLVNLCLLRLEAKEPPKSGIFPRECASCQLMSSIIHKIVSIENRTITEKDMAYVREDLGCLPSPPPPQDKPNLSLFTNLNTYGTHFKRYRIPTYEWKHADLSFGTSSQWALNRISECQQSHETCREAKKSDSTFKPSRLINVDAEGLGKDVVLVDSASVHPESPYVALSYCWGKYIPECMTTPKTVKKNMQRIPWSTMPLTFQDAVDFTRSLDVKYLWIDSICIIQGDRKDWRHEAGKMLQVYGNAHVTLACTFGHSSTSGLRSKSVEDGSIKLAELRLGQNLCPIYMRRDHLEGGLRHQIPIWGPLFHRAWTYQERMISPRVLYFTEREIIFECFSAKSCECDYIQPLGRDVPEVESSKEMFFKGVIDGYRDAWPSDISYIWTDQIVPEYSILGLTLPRDRLPAIGAIAEQFQRVLPNETYLAGLWSGTLITDLLWYCESLVIKDPQGKNKLSRPYSLPTWSWASLQSGVTFPYFDEVQNNAKVVEARCQYVEDNPFGVLESSELVLRGSLLPCIVEWQDLKPSILFWSAGELTRFDDQGVRDPYMDYDGTGYQSIPQRQEVYLLEMIKMELDRFDWTHILLILRREEAGKNIFSRAGLLITENYYRSGLAGAFIEQARIVNCEIR
ncbi:HET-domain-containing protein [Whalleya microplaca]|nr:HET-domain-containing protein [Whalleya microplaca]